MKRNNKKALSFLLTLALVFGLFAGLTITASAATYTMTAVNGGASPASGDTVTIGSATEMGYFANYVNTAGTAASTSGITFKMTSDITITWTGARGNITVGSAATSSPTVSGTGFAGIFDGNNKTLTVNVTAVNSVTGGLIGYLEPTGLVKNLTMAGIVSASGSLDAIGGVVGYNSGVINGVKNNAAVTGSSVYNIGGIAGFNDGYYATSAAGVIINSANTGNVTGASKAGGITGENAGYINSCSNTGDITNPGSGKNGAGGIAGRNGNNNTAVETGVIWNCYNKGDISVSNGRWGGGIVGFQNSLSSTDNCYNTGTITGYSNYNPILGVNENSATPTAISYRNNNSTGGTNSMIGTYKSDADMTTTTFAGILNDNDGDASSFWSQSGGINGGYPYLLNAAVDPNNGGGENPGAKTVYLDVSSGTNGDGTTTASAFNDLDDAVADAGSGGTVVVMSTVPLTAGTRNDSVTFERYSGLSDPLFDISGGEVTLTTATIDGDGSGTLVNVSSGGAFRLRGSLVLTNCAIAVNIEDGGSAQFSRAEVSASGYSFNLEAAGSQFIMNDFGQSNTSIEGTVYLAEDAVITAWANLNFELTVECADPYVERDVMIADGVDISGDIFSLLYDGGGWGFDGDEDAIWLTTE